MIDINAKYIGLAITAALAKHQATTPSANTGEPPVVEQSNDKTQNPNSFNPQISLVTDFRALLSHNDKSTDKRADLKEAELALAADVDPFLRAEAYIAFANEDGEPIAEVEEAFGSYRHLGRGLSGKFGKIAAAVGRVQRNHVDALSWMEYPLFVQDFLGEEGLRAGGASISYLLPGDKFHEITLEALDANDSGIFAGAHSNAPVLVGHYRTFFDFNDDSSAQAGITYANGPGGGLGNRSNLKGLDFVYKWQPGSSSKGLILEAEALWGKSGAPGSREAMGAFGSATMQLRSNISGYVRYDTSQDPNSTNNRNGWSVGLTLKPTEFHHWRVEWQQVRSNFEPTRNQLNLQFQLAIGAHPAHKY